VGYGLLKMSLVSTTDLIFLYLSVYLNLIKVTNISNVYRHTAFQEPTAQEPRDVSQHKLTCLFL